jgi:hypothetical protein
LIAKVQDRCTSYYLDCSLSTAQFATRSKAVSESHMRRCCIGCPVALRVLHRDSKVILRTQTTSSTVATAATVAIAASAMDARTRSHSSCDYPATG